MDRPRWWHVAVAVAVATGAAFVLTGGLPAWRVGLGLAALGAFAAAWFALGRRALAATGPAAIVLGVLVVVTVGIAVTAMPVLAVLQCVAYPMLWVIAGSVRQAIVGNVLLAASVAAGFLTATDDPVQTLLTAGLSLAFAVALGLWITSIAERSEERRLLLDELRDAQQSLAAINRDAGTAFERERLAREIHDTIAQDLTGLVLLVQRARRDLDAGVTDGLAPQLQLLEDQAREALTQTRALVAATASVSLDTGGIVPALRRLAERFERETGVTVHVQAEPAQLGRETEVVLLRCAQEGLANVRKHARASTASVELDTADAVATLRVRDDGAGFDPSGGRAGFGLDGLAERLTLVGGALEVFSGDDGTELVARLPVGVPA